MIDSSSLTSAATPAPSSAATTTEPDSSSAASLSTLINEAPLDGGLDGCTSVATGLPGAIESAACTDPTGELSITLTRFATTGELTATYRARRASLAQWDNDDTWVLTGSPDVSRGRYQIGH